MLQWLKKKDKERKATVDLSKNNKGDQLQTNVLKGPSAPGMRIRAIERSK